MKLNVVDSTGIYCAVVGIIFYVLFEFFPISVFYIFAAIFMVVALFLLSVAALFAWGDNTAYRRYKDFEALKKKLTDDFNEQSDSTAKDEKSEDEPDPQ